MMERIPERKHNNPLFLFLSIESYIEESHLDATARLTKDLFTWHRLSKSDTIARCHGDTLRRQPIYRHATTTTTRTVSFSFPSFQMNCTQTTLWAARKMERMIDRLEHDCRAAAAAVYIDVVALCVYTPSIHRGSRFICH